MLFSVVKGPQEAQMVTLALQDAAGRRLGLAEGLQGVGGILWRGVRGSQPLYLPLLTFIRSFPWL